MNSDPSTTGSAPFRTTPFPLRIRRTRIAVLGSFMGGYHLLKELLSGTLSERVEVVGVATDDPGQPFTNANRRLWRFDHSASDERLVRDFAADHQLEVYTGRILTPPFWERFSSFWQPDLCLMATFGQKIPARMIKFPKLGFFNFHHSAGWWPSYPGPDPIGDMQRDGVSNLVLTVHRVTEIIDGGEFVARSHAIPIPPGINALEMHRITWPQMGPFICSVVGKLIDESTAGRSGDGLECKEASVLYRVAA